MSVLVYYYTAKIDTNFYSANFFIAFLTSIDYLPYEIYHKYNGYNNRRHI